MDEQTFLLQFNSLPANLQREVLDFIGYLFQKHTLEKKPEPAKPIRKAGTMPGLIVHMADDFNEPLEEEFKEYMMP
ncbi:MAG: DUF2281 domain-containing protein [Phycisphaerae bacterium]|nr:DUF2281 domain-containing protein [Saprospiraceae bacterium]